MTLSLRTDRKLIRAGGRSARYVLASIEAPRAPRRGERLPVNIALVLDRSGSMSDENKFGLARKAVEQALRMLAPEDRFSLVVYDDRVDVLARSSAATSIAVRDALSALLSIGPRGSTDLASGWLRGCEQVAEQMQRDGVTRCLLLTDGLANQGETNRDVLASHAAELRRRGVVTSTFGVGADFDERLLRDMAHEGGGNFHFIEGASQIPRMLTGELGEALEVVLRDASLEFELPRGTTAELLGRHRHTRIQDDRVLRVNLGDLVSSQEMDVVVKMTFPHGEIAEQQSVRAALRSTGEVIAGSACELMWTYASHADNDFQARDLMVDREVARLYAAAARADAAEHNRAGDYERATTAVRGVARRIRSYAGNDEAMLAIIDELEGSLEDYSVAMTPMMMKSVLYASELAAKGRTAGGRARRKV